MSSVVNIHEAKTKQLALLKGKIVVPDDVNEPSNVGVLGGFEGR